MYQYHCLNKISEKGTNLFTQEYQKAEDIKDADAILVRSAAMHDYVFEKKLCAIARAGAGVNNIPVDRCAEEGIVVFNTPGANANGVKELVIAGMLLAARDITGGINWVKTVANQPDVAKLVEKEKSKFAGTELLGKKLGVIGLGAIGVLVANAAKRLGMEVYGYDPYLSVDHAWHLSQDIKYVKTTEEVYKVCDYITVHVPLMDSTKKMINEETLKMMKDGVIILNFARDLLVDDDAMEEALKSGKVAKYVTDFPNARTAVMDGVIAIPHLGASTEESEDNCAKMAVKQVKDYLENGTIVNSVNYPALDAGVLNTVSRVAICHKNQPNMLAQFTGVFSAQNVNIENLANKSRKDYAYTVIDIDTKISEKELNELAEIPGVLKVRLVK